MPSPATDDLCRTFLCRRSPARGMATSASRPVAEQPRGRAPTPPPARRPARDNNRCANEGMNVGANADANAPPLFRRASQNLATATMLLRGCSEPATSEERWVHE
jgi:hypothetical protein